MGKMLVCCGVLLVLASQGVAADQAIQFVNSAGQEIVGLYVSPPGARKWGSTLIDKNKLKPGDKITVTVPLDQGSCRCDLKYMVEGKQAFAIKNVDMCAARRIELFLKDGEATASVQ